MKKLSKGQELKYLRVQHAELRAVATRLARDAGAELAALREENQRLRGQVSNMILASIGGDGHED